MLLSDYQYFIYFLITTNVFAFAVMLMDKLKSLDGNKERISEGKMFFLCTIFGSLGVYAGMFAFRHKTRKWYFLIGVPLLFIQNISFLYIVYLYNTNFFE